MCNLQRSFYYYGKLCYCVIVFVVSLQHNINSLWNSSRKLDLSLTVFYMLISQVLEMHGMIIKIGANL